MERILAMFWPHDCASLSPNLLLIPLSITVLMLCWRYLNRGNNKAIIGIPTIPGALPVLGHLHLLGGISRAHDATVWSRWSKRYQVPVFQIMFGNRRVIVANTHETVQHLASGALGAALSSRPSFPIFDQAFGIDIGNRPMNETLRRLRTAASKAVAKSTFSSLAPMLYRETLELEQDITQQGLFGTTSIDPTKIMQRLTMNMSFFVTYGTRFDSEDPLYQGYIKQSTKVSQIRNATACWANFVPLLQFMPSTRMMIRQGRQANAKRIAYQKQLLDQLISKMANGTPTPSTCIAAALVNDTAAKLSPEEIETVCRAMLQGGSETISATVSAGIGSLSTLAGQQIQDRAYKEILAVYGSADKAWDSAFDEHEKVPYVTALYKECLRYYTVAPYANPHQAVRDIRYGDALIPRGTIVYFNSEAANHDVAYYGSDANVFRPERWFEAPLVGSVTAGPPGHHGYGVGSRACPAMLISNHVMYGIFVRLILDFELHADDTAPPDTDPLNFGGDGGDNYRNVNKSPKSFRVFFKLRSKEAEMRLKKPQSNFIIGS